MIRISQSNQHLVLAQATGSAAKVLTGVASTRAAPHGNNEAWFPNEGTIILGASEDSKKSKTLAEWQLRFDPQVEDDVEDAFLVVACERAQGGLHTERRGAQATVHVNGHVRDIIGLKGIPAGHDDYFHRPPLRRQPDFWPVSVCGTVYTWPVQKEHLQADENQTVTIEIEEDVLWDIDYVVLCCSVRVQPTPATEGTGGETIDHEVPSARNAMPLEQVDDGTPSTGGGLYVETLPKETASGDKPMSQVDSTEIHRSGKYDLVIDEEKWRLWSRYKEKPVNIRRVSIEQRFLLWYSLVHPGTIVEQAEFFKKELPNNVFLSKQNIHQVLHRLKRNLGGDLRDRMIQIEKKGQLFFADEDWSYYWIRGHKDPLRSSLRWDFQSTK